MKTKAIAAIAAVLVAVALGSVLLLAPSFASPRTSTTTTTRPCVQKAYVTGTVYCFSVTRAITNASQALMASAQTMYVVTYPQLNSLCSGNLSSCKPESLPSGYSPQCNPCTQEAPFVYHDHVLAGPLSANGNGTWRIVIVAYDPTHSNPASFAPITTTGDVVAGESSGCFLRINPTGTNSYEMSTRTVLVLSVYPAS
jgi:hypothetical protein